MGKHAFLSASASHRWLECLPSAKLCSEQEDRASPYAQQGTDCHELCAYMVEKSLGRDTEDPTGNLECRVCKIICVNHHRLFDTSIFV